MKKALLAATAALLAHAPADAQAIRHCGFTEAVTQALANDPALAASYQNAQRAIFEAALQTEPAAAQRTTAGGTIPVIFHVVLTSSQLAQIGGATGVAERVDSSIAVLNRDYGGTNPDQSKIPAVFKPYFGSTGLQFGRAGKTPTGEPSPGYEIVTAATSGITADFDGSSPANSSKILCSAIKYTTAEGGKGLAAWDTKKYLNVWVGNITTSGSFTVLGIAAPPSIFGAGNRELGVVINYGAFGKRSFSGGYYIAGIDGSRTLTHETGHYFELLHVFGNNGKCPGSGDIDDNISDTPPQDTFVYGCPAAVPANTCSNLGQMYVNYMAYSDDACLLMFTQGQAAVVQAQVLSPSSNSYSLTQNPGLLAVSDVAAIPDFQTWPNPATNLLRAEWPRAQAPSELQLVDVTGHSIQTVRQTSGQSSYQFDLSHLPRGLYLLRATFATGTAVRKVVLQ